MASDEEKGEEVPITKYEISRASSPSLRSKLFRRVKRLDEFMPFILIVVCVVAARFIGSEVWVLAAFLLTLGIYVWRRYDSRVLVGTAIFLLVLCAGLLAGGSKSRANEVAIWAYYFLVVGVLGLFIEYIREGSED